MLKIQIIIINKFFVGFICFVIFMTLPSFAAMQNQTMSSKGSSSKYFTSLDAGFIGGMSSQLKIGYGGLDANLMVYQTNNMFVQMPFTATIGNRTYINAKTGVSFAYAFDGNHTLVRGYGLYDYKQLEKDPKFSLAILGAEAYRHLFNGTAHVSTSLYIPISNKYYITNHMVNDYYGVDFTNNTFTKMISYIKIYTIQDVMLGYDTGFYGIEGFLQPYVLYPTDQYQTYDTNAKNKMKFGIGVGVKDTLFFLDRYELKMQSSVGYRYDEFTGNSINFSIGIVKQWWDENPQQYRADWKDIRHFISRSLPLMNDDILNELQVKDKAVIPGLPDIDFADNGQTFLDDVAAANKGNDVQVILLKKDTTVSPSGDFSIKKNFIACTEQYCKFKISNKQAYLINGKLYIGTDVKLTSKELNISKPNLSLGKENTVFLSGNGHLQGFNITHGDNTNTPVFVKVDGMGYFEGNSVQQPTVFLNSDATTAYNVNITNNIFGALVVSNIKPKSVTSVTVVNNHITGANLKTGLTLQHMWFGDGVHQPHNDDDKNTRVRTGAMTFMTYTYVTDPTKESYVTDASIKVTASKNTISVTDDVDAPVFMSIGDVYLSDNKSKFFDTATVSGNVHYFCAVCVLLPTDQNHADAYLTYGDINLPGNDSSKLSTTNIEKDGWIMQDIFYMSSYYYLPHGAALDKDVGFSPTLNLPVTIGNIQAHQAIDVLSFGNGILNTAVKVENIKLDTVGTVLRYSDVDTKKASITIGNVDVSDHMYNLLSILGFLNSFYGTIHMGDVTVNKMGNQAVTIVGENYYGNITIGKFTVKGAMYDINSSFAVGEPTKAGYGCFLPSIVCILGTNMHTGSVFQIGDVTLSGSKADYLVRKIHDEPLYMNYVATFATLNSTDQGKEPTLHAKMDGSFKIGSVKSSNGVTRVLGIGFDSALTKSTGTFSIGSGKGAAVSGADYAGVAIAGDEAYITYMLTTTPFRDIHLDDLRTGVPLNFKILSNGSDGSIGEIQTKIYNQLAENSNALLPENLAIFLFLNIHGHKDDIHVSN